MQINKLYVVKIGDKYLSEEISWAPIETDKITQALLFSNKKNAFNMKRMAENYYRWRQFTKQPLTLNLKVVSVKVNSSQK